MPSGQSVIFEEALALPDEQRAELAEKLADSLAGVDQAEIDRLILIEIDRRLEAFRSGRMEVVSGEEVMRELRADSHT